MFNKITITNRYGEDVVIEQVSEENYPSIPNTIFTSYCSLKELIGDKCYIYILDLSKVEGGNYCSVLLPTPEEESEIFRSLSPDVIQEYISIDPPGGPMISRGSVISKQVKVKYIISISGYHHTLLIVESL